MTAARNLKLFPEKAPQPAQRREKGTYGITDNAVIEYQKRNGRADTRVLTALAQQANYRQKTLTLPELMTQTDLGQRAVEKALVTLAAAGFCTQVGRAWRYAQPGANGGANHRANGRANSCTQTETRNAVQHGKSAPLKEVEGLRRNLKINNTYVSDLYGAATPGTGVVAGGSIAETAQQAPDGAAPGGARAETPSPSQEQTAHQHEETKDVTDSETVPPAAAPLGYRAAQDALTAAGAWDVWAKWLRRNPALSRNRAAQDAQIAQFAEWVRGGLVDELRQHAREIGVAGSFAHPYLALEARMDRAKVVQDAKQQNVDETRRAFGEPSCTPGERRRAPDGQTWTVEEVAYGLVIFEEAAAPLDVPDAVVAEWAVVS